MSEIGNSLLTASGISEKAKNHLQEEGRREALEGLVKNFLEPAGGAFVDELVYRFLLTRGDSMGGVMRNLGGALGERKFTRILISTCFVGGVDLDYLDSKTKKWKKIEPDPEIEKQIKGLHWVSNKGERTLIYNLTVPVLRKNVDFCLLNCLPDGMIFGKNKNSAHYEPEKYLSLGELKGGIDPAGADEHWKTANSALERIRTTFALKNCHPETFFIGASIENFMAKEIYDQLISGLLSNSANLTREEQVVSLCEWLVKL